MIKPEFVFVHSYTSLAANWRLVMLGDDLRKGRLTRALDLAEAWQVPIFASDVSDQENGALYARHHVQNLANARRTLEEIRAARAKSQSGVIMFVSSPDHLPRVVRDCMAVGLTRSVFMASDVAFSDDGPAAVQIGEPRHRADSVN